MLHQKISQLSFKDLPYGYDALDPYIDAQTMELHHSKHHKAYFNKLQAAIADSSDAYSNMKDLFSKASRIPAALRNNGGGHYNHWLFWKVMSPSGGGEPKGQLMEVIINDFGSFDAFKEAFGKAAAGRFGSGWAWLIVSKSGSLKITSTPNQDNPLMDVAEDQGTPILGLDVWEHAYYLKYQNRRPDYIKAFWNVVNWDEVQCLYDGAC